MRKKIFIFSLIFALLFPIEVFAETNIKDLEKKLEQIEQESEQLKEEENEQKRNLEYHKEQMSLIENELKTVEQKLRNLQVDINRTYKEINELNEKIEKKEAEINKLVREISIKEFELEKTKEKLRENIQYMSSKGKVRLLEFVFRAESISDFFTRYQMLDKINEKGEELYREIDRQKREIEALKEKHEIELNNLIAMKNELTNKKQILDSQLKESEALQKSLNQKHAQHQQSYDEHQKALESIAHKINQNRKSTEEIKREIEKAKEEALRKQREQNRIEQISHLKNGELMLPMKPGTYYISSYFGRRTDPITGRPGEMHRGVDFAAPVGTPIYAAQDGYVLFAGPASGFGNWIVIQHPNGLYTIYGHMYSNQIYVQEGTYVLAGQHIAGVGSAGRSTGPHLHFGVANSFDGSYFNYVNPMQYFR